MWVFNFSWSILWVLYIYYYKMIEWYAIIFVQVFKQIDFFILYKIDQLSKFKYGISIENNFIYFIAWLDMLQINLFWLFKYFKSADLEEKWSLLNVHAERRGRSDSKYICGIKSIVPNYSAKLSRYTLSMISKIMKMLLPLSKLSFFHIIKYWAKK